MRHHNDATMLLQLGVHAHTLPSITCVFSLLFQCKQLFVLDICLDCSVCPFFLWLLGPPVDKGFVIFLCSFNEARVRWNILKGLHKDLSFLYSFGIAYQQFSNTNMEKASLLVCILPGTKAGKTPSTKSAFLCLRESRRHPREVNVHLRRSTDHWDSSSFKIHCLPVLSHRTGYTTLVPLLEFQNSPVSHGPAATWCRQGRPTA